MLQYVQNDRPQEVLAIVRGEAIPIDPDSQCEEAYLFRTNEGG
jgi:hypothetical protein